MDALQATGQAIDALSRRCYASGIDKQDVKVRRCPDARRSMGKAGSSPALSRSGNGVVTAEARIPAFALKLILTFEAKGSEHGDGDQ
jgi:hypothetical protein